MNLEAYMQKAVELAKEKKKGDKFEMPSLFLEEEREEIGGDIKALGRSFADEAMNPLLRDGILRKVEKKSDNHWIYEKIK